MSATGAAGHGPGRHAADQAITWIRRLLLEGVLDLVAGLLDVALGLVGLAFRFQLVVASRVADTFLDIALDLGGLVGRLVLSRHDVGPSGLGASSQLSISQPGQTRWAREESATTRRTARSTPGVAVHVTTQREVRYSSTGYSLNRSNAGQRRARVSRADGLLGSVTSANVGRRRRALRLTG